MTETKKKTAAAPARSDAIDFYDEAYLNIMTLRAMSEVLRAAAAYGGGGDLDDQTLEFFSANMCERIRKAAEDIDALYDRAKGGEKP